LLDSEKKKVKTISLTLYDSVTFYTAGERPIASARRQFFFFCFHYAHWTFLSENLKIKDIKNCKKMPNNTIGKMMFQITSEK
jgi:hypothetical protein